MAKISLRDGIARAIYMTHWREGSPVWENASPEVQDWVREQADAALAYINAHCPGKVEAEE